MPRLLLSLSLLMAFALQSSAFSVFMTGDSHVCSEIYPEKVAEILLAHEPDIEFAYWGKIGAGFYTFNDTPEYMQEIYDGHPDLLIVHLGTNDCYMKDFSKQKYKEDMEVFYANVREHFPRCRMVFVTPFFNKFKDGTVNHFNRDCADATLEFSATHPDTFVVDNNAAHGHEFLAAGHSLIRPDNVHLTEKGYELLAGQVGEAIVGNPDIWMPEEPAYEEPD